MRIFFCCSLFIGLTCRIASAQSDALMRFEKEDGTVGYVNRQGDTIIAAGKYAMCFTDTFRNYAVVALHRGALVAINRQEHVLYRVFPFDNGPDNPSDGLFRIMHGNKIGYADALTGKVRIKPQFHCAFAFVDGKARVAKHCTAQEEGEHRRWLSDQWFYIDKQGHQLESN